MKSQLTCILFALLTTTACTGSDHKTPTVSTDYSAPRTEPVVVTPPAVQPPVVATTPAVVAPKVVEESHPAPTKFSDAMAQGKALADKGDHARAREMFESAARLDRKRAEPHIELARLFIATNEKGLAMVAANKAVKLAPESSPAWNPLGRAQLLRFNYDGAVLAFRQATELSPDNVWAWNNLGFAQLQQKHYTEAADALAQATSLPGATGYMWNNLGTAYEQLDQLDDARKAFDHGVQLGSAEATSSRKRLDGVKTIVVLKDVRDEKPGKDLTVHATEEPMATPDVKAEATPEVKAEDKAEDKPSVTIEAPKAEDMPAVEAPAAPKTETPDAGLAPI